MSDDETLGKRAQVRDRYATLAEAGSCCCGGGDENLEYVKALYTEEEIALLPAEVRDLAMGCGNPTALAQLQAGMTVVDLGSGAGVDAILAAMKVGPEGRVVGVDMTQEMVDRARVAVAGLGLANVEFVLGEIEHIPLDSGIADVVVSNCVINLSPEKDRVFAEAYRVLRPGGMLAVSDMVTLRPLPEAVLRDPAAWSSCVSGAVSLDEYLGLIAGAGFMKPVVRELVPYSAAQVAAFKEVDAQLFGGDGSLSADELASLEGCLASAKIVSLKVSACCG